MYKQLIFAIALFVFTTCAWAQKVSNTNTVNTETYNLWLAEDWPKLITTGKEALNNDIDFYYLRYRIGIAYYMQQNYHQAISHFRKAYIVNQQDENLNELLYFSLLYAGRTTEAAIFSVNLSENLKQKYKIKSSKAIKQADFTYSTSIYNNSNIANEYTINNSDVVNGAQDITKSLNYFNISLKHEFSPRFSIYHGYSNISKSSFVYSQFGGNTTTNNDYKVTLNQYYLSGKISVGKDLTVVLGGHYINLKYPSTVTTNGQGNNVNKTSANDYIGFLSLYKNFKYFTLGGTGYYSTLNTTKQWQADLLLTLYPFGNTNFYSVSTLSYQNETYAGNKNIGRTVFDQLFGFKLHKNIWVEGYTTIGDMHNFIKSDGFVVFNGTDVIKSRYGARMIIPIKSLKFNIDYSYSSTENSFIPYTSAIDMFNTKEFNNHSITAGLSWNF